MRANLRAEQVVEGTGIVAAGVMQDDEPDPVIVGAGRVAAIRHIAGALLQVRRVRTGVQHQQQRKSRHQAVRWHGFGCIVASVAALVGGPHYSRWPSVVQEWESRFRFGAGSNIMPLDPQAAILLESINNSDQPLMESLTPPEARRQYEQGIAVVAGSAPAMHKVSEHEAPGPLGPI